MDESLAQQFESLCGELGLGMEDAMMIFVKATIRNQGIPFKISLDKPSSDEKNKQGMSCKCKQKS